MFLLPKDLKVVSYVEFSAEFRNAILTNLSWGVFLQFEVKWHVSSVRQQRNWYISKCHISPYSQHYNTKSSGFVECKYIIIPRIGNFRIFYSFCFISMNLTKFCRKFCDLLISNPDKKKLLNKMKLLETFRTF